jgi:hypothetical protein
MHWLISAVIEFFRLELSVEITFRPKRSPFRPNMSDFRLHPIDHNTLSWNMIPGPSSNGERGIPNQSVKNNERRNHREKVNASWICLVFNAHGVCWFSQCPNGEG